MSNHANTGWYVAIGSLVVVVGVLIGVIVYLLPSKTPAHTAEAKPRPAQTAAAQPKAAAKDDRFVEGAIVGGILGSVVTHAIDHQNRNVVVVERGHRHRD